MDLGEGLHMGMIFLCVCGMCAAVRSGCCLGLCGVTAVRDCWGLGWGSKAAAQPEREVFRTEG